MKTFSRYIAEDIKYIYQFCKEKSGKITDVVAPFESYIKSFNAKKYVKNYI